MTAITDYLASPDADERVKRWHERWGDDEEWRIDADAALNAVCEQLQQRDGRHEVQLMRADNLITQRDEAERKWRHADGERNALCKRIRELEAERNESGHFAATEMNKLLARIRELEAENARLKGVMGICSGPCHGHAGEQYVRKVYEVIDRLILVTHQRDSLRRQIMRQHGAWCEGCGRYATWGQMEARQWSIDAEGVRLCPKCQDADE